MTERKKSTGATSSDDRLAALENRVALLEDVCDAELVRAQHRRDEREHLARREAQWIAGLPERLVVFWEKFVGKRLVLGRGRAVFTGLLARAYDEFTRDSEASCRAPTSLEVAEAERDAFQRGDRFFKMPERSTPVVIDPAMELTSAELEAAVLNLENVTAGEAKNLHGVVQEVFEGVSLNDRYSYPNAEPMSQMAAPGRLVIA